MLWKWMNYLRGIAQCNLTFKQQQQKYYLKRLTIEREETEGE